ncbi:ribonuclease inhibitor [Pedobacter antarcticus]|uniref:barstar family protein n=1 Tax=Pedobacter antarcticus TaxID=34086 RepID=UPI0029310CEC|nr:ribonuclease inhibitor [Pedobacter antarcticus]
MKNHRKTFIIHGAKIQDIETFFEEVNDVFMADEDWKLGQSLDAFDDMLYRSYGKINKDEAIEIIWKDIDLSENVLGLETTRLFYKKKLSQPEIFDIKLINENIENLTNGIGKTYFEIIIEIIEAHSNILLIKQ